MKLHAPEFARIAAEYHKLDHSVRGLENRDIPTNDQHFEELKLRRLHLKDKLYQMLQAQT